MTRRIAITKSLLDTVLRRWRPFNRAG